MSMTKPPLLDLANYGYWKVRVQAFISNLDEMAFDEFVGILKAFELSKSYETEGVKKNVKCSAKKTQCFEWKGYGHVRSDYANLQKHNKKAMNVASGDYETDSEDEEELLNLVAFTTFEDSSELESATTSESVGKPATASESTPKPATASESANTAKSETESDIEENSVLTKEKLKLEAKIAEAEKYASKKEEGASEAKVQLEETQKNLRMLNNGTKQLDEIMSIGKMDRYGLGFKGKCSKSDPVFVYGGKVTSASRTVTETATETESASETVVVQKIGTKNSNLESEPQRIFRPTCYHGGVVGHIRPRCFRLMSERNQMKKAYDVSFQVPTCYHCGVRGHIKRNCFRFIREFSHEGIRCKKIWVRKDELYGDGAIGYGPRFTKRGVFSN
ncbi:hypothetical protein CARUB_v10023395mg [Capsella rubella]|uniref:CCHC-type domain-containing protein n=1 Tax=Capsella rubella TaxID=81985 RepID=R0HPR2_9BRAS|nr:uncharacterized protein LOC17887801 [Capsella rubella]EOA27275.1 hypothetical protein CARUB_v10023395mg [Capsella rubella]